MEIYFKKESSPTREERMDIADSYYGNSCDLVNCSRCGCLKGKDRSFWQSSSACQMHLAITMSSTVENSVIIMHGPIGCGSAMHTLTSVTNTGKQLRNLPVKPVNWLSTNLSEMEIVTGGEKKLRKTIEYADRTFRPEIIFVISTCAPNIIGDDVEQIIRDEEKIVSAQLAAVHCPGFRSRVVSSAYDAFYHAMFKHVRFEPIEYKDYVPVNPADPDSVFQAVGYQYRKEHNVNLLSLESAGAPDEQELTRLMNALDLTVNVVAEYSNADKIRFFSEAALNVSLCEMHDDYILKYLKNTYGIPYYTGMPLGIRGTKEWLIGIGEHFGIAERAKRLADYEEKLVREAIEPFLEKLKGKRILITGGSVRSANEAYLLDELGMEVVGIIGTLYDANADGVFEKLDENNPKLPILVSDQPYEYANQIKKWDPDIVLVHSGNNAGASKLGYITIPEFDVGGSYFGFSGVFQIAKKIAFALDNGAYVKRLSEHVRLPYKKEWFNKDPFLYHKETKGEK